MTSSNLKNLHPKFSLFSHKLSPPAIDRGVQFIYISVQMSKRSRDSVGLFRLRISRKLLDYKFTGKVEILM